MSTIQELHKSYLQQHRNGAKLGGAKQYTGYSAW